MTVQKYRNNSMDYWILFSLDWTCFIINANCKAKESKLNKWKKSITATNKTWSSLTLKFASSTMNSDSKSHPTSSKRYENYLSLFDCRHYLISIKKFVWARIFWDPLEVHDFLVRILFMMNILNFSVKIIIQYSEHYSSVKIIEIWSENKLTLSKDP